MNRGILIGCLGLCLSTGTALGEPPTIYVTWEGLDPPEEGKDYIITEIDPDYPDIELVSESDTWLICSRDSDNPDGIGDIGVISSPHPENFGVTIETPWGAPGAREVKGIILDPQGEGSDTKYSNLTGGSITGNLTGHLFLQKSAGGQGGTGSFTIDGGVEGNITIPELSHLTVSGPVASTAVITIADMVGTASLTFGQEGIPGEFAGDLALSTGVPEGATVTIYGPLTRTIMNVPTIDLNDDPVAGELLIPGGGDGDIIDGGAVTGTVGVGEGGAVFSGTATFASVALGAFVKMCDGDLDGTIHITGNGDGQISVVGPPTSGGHLLSDGVIQIGGNLGYSVRVSKDALGDILVNGSISGSVLVEGDVGINGDILANADGIGSGEITGPVTVGGIFGGNICGDNLDATLCLPGNIDIQSFGPDWTVCGQPGCSCDLDAPTRPEDNEEPGYEEAFYDTNRYLSFVPHNPGQPTALRVTLVTCAPFPGAIGQWWVGTPTEYCENSGNIEPPCGYAPGLPSQTFMGAKLQCDPPLPGGYVDFAAWHGECDSGTCIGGLKDGQPCDEVEDCQGVLHVFGHGIVPSGWVGPKPPEPGGSLDPTTYEIQAIHKNCDVEVEGNFSSPLEITMSLWSDIVEDCSTTPCGEPDEEVGIVDVTAVLDKYKNYPYAPMKVRCDVDPELVNIVIDIIDVTFVLEAFQGWGEYPPSTAYLGPYGDDWSCP